MSLKSFFGKLFRKVGEFNPAQMLQWREESYWVDIDSTVFNWELAAIGQLKTYRVNGELITAREVLNRLRAKGKKVILFSCRFNKNQPAAQRLAAMEQALYLLKKHNVKFDAIWPYDKPWGRGWDDSVFTADDNGTEAMLNSLK